MKYNSYKIPKKNGKFRKIVAPSKKLLKYQQKRSKDFETAFYNLELFLNIQNTVYGFVKKRNCAMLANQHINHDTTLMMDISNFFDDVTKEKIKKFYPYHFEVYNLGDNLLYHEEGHAAQGFATSPILCNIYLTKILKNIKEELKNNKIDSVLTIYADDIQISYNTDNMSWDKRNDLRNTIETIITHKMGEYGLSINSSKTRVRYARNGYRRILGINVGKGHIRATRKTMRKLRAATNNGNWEAVGGLTAWSHCNFPK